jgi:hypothetical protein
MKKIPNEVSSILDEPPASTHQSINRCKNPKPTTRGMNLQHRNQKNNTMGEKNPKLSSFKDEPHPTTRELLDEKSQTPLVP